jgi:LacI family transcriptional regulator
MANIVDVAEKANVSITTVSHVINKTRYVSKELTDRVNKAMEELDYQPNSLASSLRSGKTKTIGLIIPDISNQYFAEISRKVEDNGLEHGYSVILCNSDDDYRKERNYLDVLIAKQVDGIAFISAGEYSENLEKAQSSNIPTVIVDRDIKSINSDVVMVDNCKGGYNATEYLIKLGHRKIACITGPSLTNPSAERIDGYKQALSNAGISINQDFIRTGDYRFPSGEKAMQELVSLEQPPTAVFACNDMMALGAYRAITDIGLKIPDDISIIGFDNIPFSQAVYPTLTTIQQPIQKIAKLVIDLLIEKITLKNQRIEDRSEEPEYYRIYLDTELIIRNSCKEIYWRDHE